MPQAVVHTQSAPQAMTPEEARSVQEFRLDFSPEIRALRVELTGKRYVNGGTVTVFENALLCEKHFSRLIPMLHLPNTKGWTLSRIHEEKAEAYVIGMLDNIHRWMMANAYWCEDCGVHHDYTEVSNVLMLLESFFYGNFNRSVAGFEAENLSKIQQVTTREDYLRSQDRKSGGLLNIFRGGRR